MTTVDLPNISILNFFSMEIDCNYFSEKKDKTLINKKYLLPSTCIYTQEEEFSRVYMGWNEKKIYLCFSIETPQKDFKKEDFIDLFFDTRCLKTKGYITKYCHHFIFYPQKEEKKEITKFRIDDMHIPCSDEDLYMNMEKKSENAYLVKIEIPINCLFGFDYENQKQISFAFRIRLGQLFQHFCVSSNEYSIQKYPNLWTCFNLKKGK
jgi:hypothetical protein